MLCLVLPDDVDAKAEKIPRCRHTGTGACTCVFMTLAHAASERAGPSVFAFLKRIADTSSSSDASESELCKTCAAHWVSMTLLTVPLRLHVYYTDLMGGSNKQKSNPAIREPINRGHPALARELLP